MGMQRLTNMMTQKVERVLERWTSKLSDDGSKMEMSGERVVDGGKWFTHVAGSFTKSKGQGQAVDASTAGMTPAPAAMSKLAKLRGLYDIKGKMLMAPGTDAMPITGNERMEPIFDGHVLEMRTLGDPVDGMPDDSQYEGLAYLGWNPIKKSYDMIQVSNMGEMAFMTLRRSGANYVGTWMGTMQGAPVVKHTVLMCDDKGQMTGVKTYQMNGHGKPFVSFEASYKIRQ